MAFACAYLGHHSISNSGGFGEFGEFKQLYKPRRSATSAHRFYFL